MSNDTPRKQLSPRKNISWQQIVPWAVVGAIVLGLLVFSLRPAEAKVTVVDSKGVQQAAAQGVRIVDVRSPGEFSAGHIPGAQNVPLESFQATASQWDKSAPVLVYCQSGSRSAEAVKMLQALGFQKILHFDKGIVAWTGQLDQGGGAAAQPALKPTVTPVLYEFYTGW